jgi:hypothetical protein
MKKQLEKASKRRSAKGARQLKIKLTQAERSCDRAQCGGQRSTPYFNNTVEHLQT